MTLSAIESLVFEESQYRCLAAGSRLIVFFTCKKLQLVAVDWVKGEVRYG